VASLDEIAQRHTALDSGDLAWLDALVADWQMIADLAFADLVLWLPDAESTVVWAGAQVRPATGPTTLLEDVTETSVPVNALDDARTVDVRRSDRLIGHLEIRAASGAERQGSALESAYRASADDLLHMVSRGEFPLPGDRTELADPLRVGEGFIRLAANGTVDYASPNALSAYRRLGLVGDLSGTDLGVVTTTLVGGRPTDRGAGGLLRSGRSGEAEIEGPDVSVAFRVIPLRRDGARVGALVLLRDVTALRRRERQLVSKEATIREIHHRVKNNLQTVAALLRLQGRRMEAPPAKAALDDAVRRVGSIALVHEILSQSFDESVAFDDIADRLLHSILDVAGDASHGTVRVERIGSFGLVPADVATALAMVLAELIQNAAQHAYPAGGGRLIVAANRIRERLRVRVSDDGVGMPRGAEAADTLGLSIVRTLVETELAGTLAFEPGRRGGTTVTISLEV
jgi:two-component sensor histidine kinase